jgi:hypothetical protein
MKKIESFKEYIELAVRTLAPLDTRGKNRLHMALGNTSELGEMADALKKHLAYKKPFDVVNFLEEIGDFFWYIACLVKLEEDLNPENFTPDNIDSTIIVELPLARDHVYESYEVLVEDLSEDFNKALHVYITLDKYLVKYRSEGNFALIPIAYICCELLGVSPYDVMTTNINKLRGRFPDKFTEEKALNRDLDSERKILEDGTNRQIDLGTEN